MMADELAPPDTIQPQQPSTLDLLFHAIHGQESSYGANPATSSTGAVGDMQIEPATFQRFAQPGENINNRADNIAVGKRILGYYLQKYNGDAARASVAYFSGEGNVSPPGYPTPYLRNSSDGNTTVAQYVASVGQRMGDPNVKAAALGGGVGGSALLPMSQVASPKDFSTLFGDAVADTAQKQQEQTKEAEAQPTTKGGPPIGGAIGSAAPLGVAPAQLASQPAPSKMDYYLALLKRGGGANG